MPPELPDENTIEEFRAVFRSQPRVREAWVVGSRNTPVDGSTARDSADIAIVFDPPLPDGHEEPGRALMDLMRMLEAKGHGRGTGRSWLILDPAVIAAHSEHATRIYSRF